MQRLLANPVLIGVLVASAGGVVHFSASGHDRGRLYAGDTFDSRRPPPLAASVAPLDTPPRGPLRPRPEGRVPREAPEDAGLKTGPRAVFTWSVAERYEDGWEAWRERSASYDSSYVHPENWTLALDGCASSGVGDEIVEYTWTIRGITAPEYSRRLSLGVCKIALREQLPSTGRYEVSLDVTTKSGDAATVSQTIDLKDWLIVSIGDSFSSGEGCPDVPGDFALPFQKFQACNRVVAATRKAAIWKDRRCHRSAWSGAARAAGRLEREDDRTSVTFLSFACSGAEIRHLVDDRYKGQEPPRGSGDEGVPPQIAAVKAAVGDRPIDALLISIGINDLDLSGVMTACGHPVDQALNRLWPGDPCWNGIEGRLAELDAAYDRLARAIERELDVREVYVQEYPVYVLEAGAGKPDTCECLDFASAGINETEVAMLTGAGRRLNVRLAHAARRHGWNLVYGIAERFEGRGYCAPDGRRFFVQRLESLQVQGPRDGAMHPNRRGHAEVANLLFDAIELGADTRPWARVTVTFDRIKVSKFESGTKRPTNVRFEVDQRVREPFQSLFDWLPPLYSASFDEDVPRGVWVELPAGRYSFAFDLFQPPVPLRYATDFDIDVMGDGMSVGEVSVATEPGFGPGADTYVRETPGHLPDYFGIEYTVSVTRRLRPLDPRRLRDEPAATPARGTR